jgi:hypothetical protein
LSATARSATAETLISNHLRTLPEIPRKIFQNPCHKIGETWFFHLMPHSTRFPRVAAASRGRPSPQRPAPPWRRFASAMPLFPIAHRAAPPAITPYRFPHLSH